MRVRILIALLVVACGDGETEADKKRAKLAAACERGDAPSCFAATQGIDYTKRDLLTRAMQLWARGCELDHAASCGQLGTVAEFGMASEGRSDRATAALYYARACKLGDKQSCKAAGLPGGEDPKPHFPWREALTPVCGKGHGELGPLFDGLALGGPMPDAIKQRIADYEKKYKARIHYYAGDPYVSSSWSIDVRFEEQTDIRPLLVQGWGKPDLPFGAWISDATHVIAYATYGDRNTGVAWTPYRSVAEVIRPDDKTTLGIEPFPAVGAKLADLKAALGNRLLASAEHEYRYSEIGPGPAIEVRVTEKRGVIVELRTFNWITNSPTVGDALFAALETKWGTPAIDKAGTRTWRIPGRTVRARKPASGNFELVITKR